MQPRRVSRVLAAVAVVVASFGLATAASTATGKPGGIFRVLFSQQAGLDHVDPALSFTPAGWALIDTFCARLLTNPDKPPPEGFRIVPEVAVALPKVSRDAKTFTFTLRKDFTFSDGKPVRASAFARAINRTLAPAMKSPGAMHTRDIVGAADVLAGRARAARGVVARGNTLTIRLTRPAPSFPARLTLPFFCAVPPNLPNDPEGLGVFPAAGPYHVVEYVPGKSVHIRRNEFYAGKRPHHVDAFSVTLDPGSVQEMLRTDRPQRVRLGSLTRRSFFDPSLGLVEKHGINRSRLLVRDGLGVRMLVFNSSRPLFRSNPGLRRAINFALDRKALEATGGGPVGGRLTDQYLPFTMPGFRDADIYPLDGPDLARARALAEGNLRDGKAVLLTPDFFLPFTTAQLVKRQLEPLGLDVTLDPVPLHIASTGYFDKLLATDAAWDMAIVLWTPNLPDPSVYMNLLLQGQAALAARRSRGSRPSRTSRR